MAREMLTSECRFDTVKSAVSGWKLGLLGSKSSRGLASRRLTAARGLRLLKLIDGDKTANLGQKNARRTGINGQNHRNVCEGARVSERPDDGGIRPDSRRSRGSRIRRLSDDGDDHHHAARQR